MQSIDLSNISVKYRNESSYNGYNVSDLKSGLQKYIRRGNFEKAMYCAWELYLFKLVDGGKRIFTNFIHRLMIITLEDICDINVFNSVWKLFSNILKDKSNVNERNINIENNIKNIVKILCDSVKSRENSYYKCVFYNCPSKILSEYPDVDKEINDYVNNENTYQVLLFDEDYEINMLCYNFLNLFRNKNPMCILYGHRICEVQTNKKYYNKKRGKYLLMYIIEKELKKNSLFEINKDDKFIINTFQRLHEWLDELDGLKEDVLCW